MNPIHMPRVFRIVLLVLGLALMAGAVHAQAPAHAATPTIATVAPSGLPGVLPPDTDLHTRFQTALGQVEGKLVRLVAATPLLLVAATIVLLAAWLGRVLSRRGHWFRLRSHNPYMDGLVRRIVQTFVLLAGVFEARRVGHGAAHARAHGVPAQGDPGRE